MFATSVGKPAFSLLLGILGLFVLASATPVAAQRRPKVSSKKLEGSVIAVANGFIKVKSKHGDKEAWVIKPQGVSQFLATAPRDWLRPGVIVMVTSEFDEQGRAPFPVAMVQAFTPRPGRVMGMVQDPSTVVEGADPTAPKTYILAGPIESIEDGSMTIKVGRKSFVVPMQEEVEVNVDLINDLSWVREGDEFKGKIQYMRKGREWAQRCKSPRRKRWLHRLPRRQPRRNVWLKPVAKRPKPRKRKKPLSKRLPNLRRNLILSRRSSLSRT